MAKQNQTMGSIFRILVNFKKFGQNKMTRAVVQSRITTLKEKFAQCQDLDAMIMSSINEAEAKTLPYVAEDQFIACEESFEEAIDYMAEVLEKMTVAA